MHWSGETLWPYLHSNCHAYTPLATTAKNYSLTLPNPEKLKRRSNVTQQATMCRSPTQPTYYMTCQSMPALALSFIHS